MNRWTRLGLGLLVFLGFTVGTSVTVSSEEQGGRVIIGFHETIDDSFIEKIASEVHHTYERLNAVSISVDQDQWQLIEKHPDIKWVEHDQKVRTSAQEETWGYETTKIAKARDWSLTGKGVKIAIVDTGIAQNHPDLNVEGGTSLIEDNDSWDDDNGHGTHVAGVIAAQDNEIGVVGVAPDSKIYAVKALDKQGDGWESEIIAGVEWAIEEGVDIINLSLTSCQPSEGMEQTLERAEQQGIVVVAASGNGVQCGGEYLKDVMYPARYENVISVGAVDQRQTRALFSYGGESLDFVAPGTQVYSTYITTDKYPEGYRSMNGTSMAAPYVSGILALAVQSYSRADEQKLKSILENNVIDLGEEGKDFDYGHGLIQSLEMPFNDIKADRWYYSSVQDLYKIDVVKGFDDGTFKPQGDITREEVVTMVGRTIGLNGEKRDTAFPDVSRSSFASGFIASSVEAGIIEGFPDGTFGPKEKITRGDVAVIVERAFDLPSSSSAFFDDVNADCYCYASINAVAEAGIIEGYTDGTFRHNKHITRAELAGILARSLK